MSIDDSSTELQKWHPNATVCVISDELIYKQSGETDFRHITVLDLHLRDGSLGKIRKIENLEYLVNIRQLNISYNAITRIEGLTNLTSLVELNLAENSIKKIENIFTLQLLERLSLCGNDIERIPAAIANLKSLTILRLNRNQLSVRKDLENLSPLGNLRELRIDNNLFGAEDQDGLRLYTIFSIPLLRVLDNVSISAVERSAAREAHAPSELTQLKQRLLAEQRRAEILDAEAHEIRKQHQQLSMRSPTAASASVSRDHGASDKLDLLSRLRIEKTNEATAAKSVVSQLQQELTYKTIDANFDRWGEATSSSESSMGADRSEWPSPTPPQRVTADSVVAQAIPSSSRRGQHRRRRERVDSGMSVSDTEHDEGGAAGEVKGARSPARGGMSLDEANSHINRLSERVERLGSKLLQAEREKSELLDRTREMESELRARDEDLVSAEDALRAAQDEIRRLKATARSHVAHGSDVDESGAVRVELEEAVSRIQKLQAELDQVRSRGADDVRSAAHEVKELRFAVEDKDHVIARIERDVQYHVAESARWKSELEKTVSALKTARDDLMNLERRNHLLELDKASWELKQSEAGGRAEGEGRDILKMRDDIESEHAQRTIDQLRRDLEDARRQATASRDVIAKSTEEGASFRESLRQKELQLASLQEQVESQRNVGSKLESLQKKSDEELQSERRTREHVERELRSTRQQLAEVQADLEAYVGTIKTGRHVAMPPDGNGSSASYFPSHDPIAARQAEGGGGGGGYFDETESTIDSAEPFALQSPRRAQPEGSAAPASSMPVGRLERAAVESISAVILEELERDGRRGSDRLSGGKDAAVRAALRLVYSATRISREKGAPDGIAPLEALGDRKVLAELVAQAQAGLAAIADAKTARAEVLQQQRVIADLTVEEKKVMASLDEKELSLKLLSDNCDHAKKEAQTTLSELSQLVEQLRDGQRGIQTQESKLNSLRKEINDARVEFGELNSLSQMEHKNIATARSRLAELHKECSDWETRVASVKEKYTNEDMRLRSAKSTGNDQIRLLQSDLLKLHADLKAKKRALDETDRLRKSMEVESESRQRELNQQLLVLARDTEEASRALMSAQAAVRSARLEAEELQNRKKHMDGELQLLEDKRVAESRRLASEIEDGLRRKKELEQKISSTEKRHRSTNDQLSALQGEMELLRHTVEDLERSKSDLERIAGERQRALTDDVASTQQQAQAAIRATRQATTELEQTRAARDSIESECRVAERRCEELRRVAKEHETEAEKHQGTIKALQAEHSKYVKDVQTLKREEEEVRLRLQVLRSTTDGEDREAEDVRRRLNILLDEEADLKDRESKLKASWAQLKKGLEDCQNEVHEARVASERERRALSDIRSKKAMMEADTARCEEELKFLQEQMEDEEKRRIAVQADTQRAREELAQIRKETMSAQRKHTDALRVEAEWKRREGDAVQIQNKLRMEMESLGSAVGAERHKLESLSRDRDEVLKESKQVSEELGSAQRELASAKVALEAVLSQQMHALSVKEELQLEISRMREAEKVELLRAERINESYKELERRLKEVRAELSREESSYARVKSRSMEEESKLADRHRSLYSATEELSKIEGLMAELHSNIHEERGRAIEEISRLGQVKQSVESQMFMFSEAQRRSNRLSGGGARGFSPSALESKQTTTSGSRRVTYIGPQKATDSTYNRAVSPLTQSHTDNAVGGETVGSDGLLRNWKMTGSSDSASRWGTDELQPSSGGSHLEQKTDRPIDSGVFGSEREGGYPDPGEYSSSVVRSEISDLREEMQKLSAQSAAVLRNAEAAEVAARARTS